MNIWKRLKKLSIRQLLRLTQLFLKHPLLLLPTLSASKKAYAISETLFEGRHHKSNKANAFRHALWNVLICKNTFRKTKNKQRSVFWAQQVTDLYEEVTRNEPLDEAMDLHNNAVGRMVYLNFLHADENTIIDALQNKVQTAKKVDALTKMKMFQKELVYLED